MDRERGDGVRKMSESEPRPVDRYADEATSIRALAAQAKSAEVREQLFRIADLYEKLELLLRDAALHSLVTMASTLQGDLDGRGAAALEVPSPRVEGA